MSKEKYLKFIEDIVNSYDAFLINNKYCNLKKLDGNTHELQFKELAELFKEDEEALRMLKWMLEMYDCYYKEEHLTDDGNPIHYLRSAVESKFEVINNE